MAHESAVWMEGNGSVGGWDSSEPWQIRGASKKEGRGEVGGEKCLWAWDLEERQVGVHADQAGGLGMFTAKPCELGLIH